MFLKFDARKQKKPAKIKPDGLISEHPEPLPSEGCYYPHGPATRGTIDISQKFLAFGPVFDDNITSGFTLSNLGATLYDSPPFETEVRAFPGKIGWNEMLTTTATFTYENNAERIMDRHVPQFRELIEIWLVKNQPTGTLVLVTDVQKAVGWAHRIANEDQEMVVNPSPSGKFESLRDFRNELASRV